MAYRKDLVSADVRALGVLTALETLTNWCAGPGPSLARGMAYLTGFGSYVAMAADVASAGGNVSVKKVCYAIDCGVAVNPGSTKAQIQGGAAHGLSATLWGEQTIVLGVPQVKTYDHYRMFKLHEMPDGAVSIVPSTGGSGRGGRDWRALRRPCRSQRLGQVNRNPHPDIAVLSWCHDEWRLTRRSICPVLPPWRGGPVAFWGSQFAPMLVCLSTGSDEIGRSCDRISCRRLQTANVGSCQAVHDGRRDHRQKGKGPQNQPQGDDPL